MDPDDRTTRRLKMSDLRMLLAVAQRGSMSKAAENLNISQSAVSKALRDLEHTLGVPLLDRHAQGVEPTPYGRTLIERGKAIFDELHQGVRDIRFLADPAGGELRVGIGPPFAGFLAEVIERLARRHPKMVFHVVERDVSILLGSDLRERTIDLMLGRIAIPAEDGLNVQVLFEDDIFVIAGAANPWTKRRKVELRDLVGERWVLPILTNLAGAHISEAFSANGLPLPRVSVVSNSIRVRDHLLATGRYLSMVPGVQMQFDFVQKPFKILPVKLSIKPRPVGIVTIRGRTLGPAAQLFIDEVRALAKRLPRPMVSR